MRVLGWFLKSVDVLVEVMLSLKESKQSGSRRRADGILLELLVKLQGDIREVFIILNLSLSFKWKRIILTPRIFIVRIWEIFLEKNKFLQIFWQIFLFFGKFYIIGFLIANNYFFNIFIGIFSYLLDKKNNFF